MSKAEKEFEYFYDEESINKVKRPLFLHIALFGFTFLASMIAGTQWAGKNYLDVNTWHFGLTYAILIMTFLTAHEFGHYFAARIHKVEATLPYYIPFPYPFTINFGTFGAVIKTLSPIPSRKALFDIGAAGPIAGFIVSVAFLIYGFATLPHVDYLYGIHPEYLINLGGDIPKTGLHFGDTILYGLFEKLFANTDGYLPPMNELYHYPFLNVGWFGLFVTCMNMLPLGQLDGGHIVYAMFGKLHSKISRTFWYILLALGASSLLGIFYDLLKGNYADNLMIKTQNLLLPPLDTLFEHAPVLFGGWFGWLIWAVIAKFFVKLDHPPVMKSDDIGLTRKIIGWLTLAILVICFTWNGIYWVE